MAIKKARAVDPDLTNDALRSGKIYGVVISRVLLRVPPLYRASVMERVWEVTHKKNTRRPAALWIPNGMTELDGYEVVLDEMREQGVIERFERVPPEFHDAALESGSIVYAPPISTFLLTAPLEYRPGIVQRAMRLMHKPCRQDKDFMTALTGVDRTKAYIKALFDLRAQGVDITIPEVFDEG